MINLRINQMTNQKIQNKIKMMKNLKIGVKKLILAKFQKLVIYVMMVKLFGVTV